jgi:NitT/TauT family transport system substrate-binding protein
VFLAAAAVAAGGCSGSEDGGGDSSGSVAEVTFLTGLGQSGRQGYPYVAEAKGFFAEENLKVTIEPGKAGDSNMQLVRGGQAQFAAIEYAGSITRAAVGEFDGVHCISVIDQKTTNALMALASSGIRTARDLPGKTVGVVPGSAPKTLFPAYAELVGLDDAQIKSVKFVEAPGNQLPALLAAGKVDAIGQFAPAEPTVSAAAKGAPVTVLPYGDYMTDMYGAVLVSRDDVDADVKRRFARALHRGLRYAVDHPDEAAQHEGRGRGGGAAPAQALRRIAEGDTGTGRAQHRLDGGHRRDLVPRFAGEGVRLQCRHRLGGVRVTVRIHTGQ